MAIYRFKIYPENEEHIFRVIDFTAKTNFKEVDAAIRKFFGFKKEIEGEFLRSNASWQYGSPLKFTDVLNQVINDPRQHILYGNDQIPDVFFMELTGVLNPEDKEYPFCVRSEGKLEQKARSDDEIFTEDLDVDPEDQFDDITQE